MDLTYTPTEKIELIKSVAEVQSNIKKIVTSDFILSKLSEKEKTYVIEMTSNAFLAKKIMTLMANKAKKWRYGYAKKGDKEKSYYQTRLEPEEIEIMEQHTQLTFDTYMNKIYLINILARNVPKNYIVEKLTGQPDEEEGSEDIKRMDLITKKLKKRMGIKEDENLDD